MSLYYQKKIGLPKANGEPQAPSFKETLISALGGMEDILWGDHLEENMSENQWYKEGEHDKIFSPGPVIPLSDEELTLWFKPWRNSLIVKVLGKRVNFKMLEYKVQRSWVKEGLIKITDMTDDFHVVRVSSEGG